MQYPNYEAHDHIRTPIEGLLDVFARHEAGAGSNLPNKWSNLLGEMAVHVLRDNSTRLHRGLNMIKSLDNIPKSHLFLRDVIMFRNNTREVIRAQQRLHQTTVEGIESLAKKRPAPATDKMAKYKGQLSEHVALALLTRYAHPWLLASPALPHHEKDDKIPDHYDIALALASEDGAASHLLQVKHGCSGRCDSCECRHAYRYSKKVQIISSCCDLGIVTEKGLPSLDVPKMLISEYKDSATASEVKALDVLTDNLIFNISAGILPTGVL